MVLPPFAVTLHLMTWKHQTMNLNTESAVYDITAFRGNTAFNDMETYQTMNLNTEHAVYDITAFRGNTVSIDIETHQIMNLEHEEPRHNCYASGYEPIIPVKLEGVFTRMRQKNSRPHLEG